VGAAAAAASSAAAAASSTSALPASASQTSASLIAPQGYRWMLKPLQRISPRTELKSSVKIMGRSSKDRRWHPARVKGVHADNSFTLHFPDLDHSKSTVELGSIKVLLTFNKKPFEVKEVRSGGWNESMQGEKDNLDQWGDVAAAGVEGSSNNRDVFGTANVRQVVVRMWDAAQPTADTQRVLDLKQLSWPELEQRVSSAFQNQLMAAGSSSSNGVPFTLYYLTDTSDVQTRKAVGSQEQLDEYLKWSTGPSSPRSPGCSCTSAGRRISRTAKLSRSRRASRRRSTQRWHAR